ncbi:MAG: hypothetical protein AB2806_21380 [Candidatus Thiodiazotropha sp.]
MTAQTSKIAVVGARQEWDDTGSSEEGTVSISSRDIWLIDKPEDFKVHFPRWDGETFWKRILLTRGEKA